MLVIVEMKGGGRIMIIFGTIAMIVGAVVSIIGFLQSTSLTYYKGAELIFIGGAILLIIGIVCMIYGFTQKNINANKNRIIKVVAQSKKVCPKCNASFDEKFIFCPNCGGKIEN